MARRLTRGKAQYKGVSWAARRRCWVAQIGPEPNRPAWHLGMFNLEIEAAQDPGQLNTSGNVFQHGPLSLTGLFREEMTRLFAREFLAFARKQ